MDIECKKERGVISPLLFHKIRGRGGMCMDRNVEEIVRRADLVIDGVVRRSEGGLPIGNGTMGTLVWTSPSALKMQINRVDVFANDSYSNSFNERHMDYGYGCAYVDIDFANFSKDVFNGNTRQHLSLYSAEGSISGGNVHASFFACEGDDALVFNITDTRKDVEGINIRLNMLRPAEVRTKSHFAHSWFEVIDDIAVLCQEFYEGEYYCASAVAAKVNGKRTRIRMNNESSGRSPGIPGRSQILLGMETERELRISVEPEIGSFDIFLSSAATFDRGVNIAQKAVAIARRTSGMGVRRLKNVHDDFWRSFWRTSYVALSGNADCEKIEKHYQYYMYIMGCCSRNNRFPPNFGGLLFSTRGDLRHWGTMQWWNNLSLYYNACLPAGHSELLVPYLNFYFNMLDRCMVAAKQQWNSSGAYIPEVVGFDGPEVLPDSIAQELCDLMLMKKPWENRSEAFNSFAFTKRPHESRWNFKHHERWEKGKLVYGAGDDSVRKKFGKGVTNYTTHMLGTQAGVAFHFWEYFQYNHDLKFLRERAYPLIRAVAEFYRTFPNIKLAEDGMYHSYHTNSGEGYFNGTDSIETSVGMHGIYPIAIRASEILETDAVLRNKWKERLTLLFPLATSDDKRIVNSKLKWKAPVWVPSVCDYYGENETPISGASVLPIRRCDLCTLETKNTNKPLYDIGKESLNCYLAEHGMSSRRMVSEMSEMGRVLANMGNAEKAAEVIVNQINCINAETEYCYYQDNGKVPRYENRLTTREGINALSAQRLGNVASAVQCMLLQASGGSPTAEPVLHLFPATPANWNVQFVLYAKGGFRVETSIENGRVGVVKITSLNGSLLKVRNPWSTARILINGMMKDESSDPLLTFATDIGDVLSMSEKERE